jgi:hypothetical protein
VSDPEKLANARVEYAAASDNYMHYDAFRWQAGSFLIAGVFVFWGLLIQQSDLPALVITVASLLITCMMSVWLMFAYHYRQIYLGKLDRLHELEKLLGAEQHRRFRAGRSVRYKLTWPKGHDLDIAVYVLTSLGSVFLGMSRDGFDWSFLSPLVLVVPVIWWVRYHDKQFTEALKTEGLEGTSCDALRDNADDGVVETAG